MKKNFVQSLNLNLEFSPQKRLNEKLVQKLKSKDVRIDIHTHLFNIDYIPSKYFQLRLPYIVNTDFLLFIDENLKNQYYEDDEFARFVKFLNLISKSSLSIFRYLLENTPSNTVFAAITMDFTGIQCKAKKSYSQQVDELKNIRDTFEDRIIPFLAVNPKNPNLNKILEKAFSDDYNFYGIKLYPSLGFLPSHPKLMSLYEVCEKNNIPIIVHSGNGNVHTTKNLLNLQYYDLDEQDNLVLKKVKKFFLFKNQYISFFNNPENWEIVLRKYPNLRLNFAHFGGVADWDDKEKNDRNWFYAILDLMERYPNVYGDISYILHLPNFTEKFLEIFKKNKTFADRVLFGTDFFMILLEDDYKNLRSRFVNNIGSQIMDKIARINTLKFLGLEDFV